MPPGSGAFALQETSITVEGDGGMSAVSFTHLHIRQELADTCSFLFIWRTENTDTSFSTHVDFYRTYLGKEVSISIGEDYAFKGFIQSISCINQGGSAIANEYQVMGKGLFAKLDEVEECNSFYHKSLTDIFNSLNTAQNTMLNLSPSNTSELFYHVQYNATTFRFYKMLATRYGEWLYYDGEQLNLGVPSGEAIELINGVDIQDIQIHAEIRKTAVPGVGYDQYSGEILTNTPSTESGSGMTGAATEAADAAFGSEHTARRIATAPTSELLREMNTLMQRAAAASSVYLEGKCHYPSASLGKKIRIMDSEGNSEGEYIITQVSHSAVNSSNYHNHFVAVPADVQVPPYTNPLIYPVCYAQQATVVDNEDADGLDRIKVRFPWMQQTETSPWISVMVPYAGNGRGMRFIPEVDEEVMIDFVDNNAERPIMIGSFYTTANTSGIAHEGNHVKTFGTRTGRRFEIDDDKGLMRIYDNMPGESNINAIQLKRTDQQQTILLSTNLDDDNYCFVFLDKNNILGLQVVESGDVKTEILLEKNGPKITIHSKGAINMNADGNISLNAGGDITMTAQSKVKIEGKQGIEMKGLEIKGEADTNLELKGLNAKLEGSVQMEAKGGAMAIVQGGIVKIN